MEPRRFGTMPDGTEVGEIRLAGDGVEACILTYGAVLRDLAVETETGRHSVVLSFPRLEDYLGSGSFFGAVAGRCANRIAGGRFDLDGRTYDLDRNEAGRTHLHGGSGGSWNRVWTVVDAGPAFVELELVSPDGDCGYPGIATLRCRYAVAGPGRLAIDLSARTDRPTLVNLATHSYFDLDRGETILDHLLTIPADRVTPVDDSLIPTGAIAAVAGTPLDFRRPKPVGEGGGGLDLNYVLAAAPVDVPRTVARLEGRRSGLALEVNSTEPGLQVYDGNMMGAGPVLADGRPFRRHGGICLEPQRFPDAIHHPAFPTAVLRPGETYRQATEYHVGPAA